MFLADDLADIMKNIFFMELLAGEERSLTINNYLVNEFNNRKDSRIDLVDGWIDLNED